MKKEIIFLSLPDHFNKFLLVNSNQKFNLTDKLYLQFNISDVKAITSAVKAIYCLEYIFPRKVITFCIKTKKKKKKFNQQNSNSILFKFNLNISAFEFISFYRFFFSKPFKKLEQIPISNRKLRLFNFFFDLKTVPINLTSSFVFLKNYHLN